MNQFVEAVANQESRTLNGMKARKSSANALVDFFYNVGASRGKDIIPQFTSAFVQNKELALRIALWSRDVRKGAGEREIFKQILNYLESTDPELATRLIKKIPELGRWDDGLCLKTKEIKNLYFSMLGDAIRRGQEAKHLLSKIDDMSESECKEILDNL